MCANCKHRSVHGSASNNEKWSQCGILDSCLEIYTLPMSLSVDPVYFLPPEFRLDQWFSLANEIFMTRMQPKAWQAFVQLGFHPCTFVITMRKHTTLAGISVRKSQEGEWQTHGSEPPHLHHYVPPVPPQPVCKLMSKK